MQEEVLTGKATAYASFGELVQGRLPNNTDFLVTLPIDLFSTAHVRLTKSNRTAVLGLPEKSTHIAELFLQKYTPENYTVLGSIQSEIPVGKGISSSTADQLATIRALQNAVGIKLSNEQESDLLSAIEPHDGLHFVGCAVYDHRKGKIVREYKYTPRYQLLIFDFRGKVDTIEYNRRLHFSDEHKQIYSDLLEELDVAFKEKNDERIAIIATEAAYLDASKKNQQDRLRIISQSVDALGAITTHSGACVALIFPIDKKINKEEIINQLNLQGLRYTTFITTTLTTTQQERIVSGDATEDVRSDWTQEASRVGQVNASSKY